MYDYCGHMFYMQERCLCMIIVVTCFICRNWFRSHQGMMRGRVTTLESFWEWIDITEHNRVLIAIHSGEVPEKTSSFVDTGASRTVLGLFVVFGYGS